MGKIKPPKYIWDQEQYFNSLSARFENIGSLIMTWGGELPEGLTSYYIEQQQYNRGALCYFEADYSSEGTTGEMMLPVARWGKLNVYSIPTQYNLISPLRTFRRNITNSVLVRNNLLMIPTRHFIDPLLAELADIRYAMMVNRNESAKTPAVYTVDASEALTVENEHKQKTGNKPIIIRTRGAAVAPSYNASEHAPYFGKELREEYNNVKNEALTLIGTLYNPVEKAERVNTIESKSNQGELIDTIDSMLYFRQEACDEIERMFGRKLTVSLNNRATDELLQGIEDINNSIKEGDLDANVE